MAASPFSTAPLRRLLERHLPERPFALELWDGTRLPATVPTGPTIAVRSRRAVGHVVRAPGQLGLTRAYVTGELDADDLDAVIELAETWTPPRLDASARLRLTAAALAAAGPMLPPPVPAVEHRPSGGRLHSLARDARAVRHHYDVSNDFFRLFLDESMTYSCAVWRDGARTLEEAQEAKLELVCAKLGLRPGMRLLDVGCGWGSLLLHAARHHGAHAVGITLSPPQAELARERARDAGLSDRVEVRVMDYRELGGERFDAVASIGMIEHVGSERIDDYARAVARVVPPGAPFLCHGITRIPPDEHELSAFTARYLFPDGKLLHPSALLRALERAGFETLHLEGFREDYAKTLRHWTSRLEANLPQAERLGGEERLRVWRLYMRGARAGFERGHTSVHQALTARTPRAA